MPEFDLTNPALQQLLQNSVQAVNQNNQSKLKETKERERQERHEQKIEELLLEVKAVKADMQTLKQPAQVVTARSAAQKVAAPYSNYAPDMDVSIGCIPCTRAHLATVSSALKEAANNPVNAPTQVAAAREEMTALLEYDLTPDKLAATPEQDRVILSQYADRMRSMQRQLQGPVPETTVAAASLKEALRFAREDGLQHPEVQIRMERTEEAINALERVNLTPEKVSAMAPEQAAAAKAALPEIRRARQDLINHVHSVDDLEAVTARIAVLDQRLNPTPDAKTVQQLSGEMQQMNQQFRQDVLQSFQQRKHA